MKLEEGDFKGAVRLACSEDTIAPKKNSTLDTLRQKHPPPHPNSQMPPPSEEPSRCPIVSADEVALAIRSFPNGSTGGPDGLLPQHLKDMTGASAESGGPVLLSALTTLVNIIPQGKIMRMARPLFFGASLTALTKKDGGVRPIAVAALSAGLQQRQQGGASWMPCESFWPHASWGTAPN